MPRRLSHVIPVLVAVAPAAVLGSITHTPVSTTSSTLRIEAMGPRPLHVELTSIPAGLVLDSARTAEAPAKLVVVTPVVVSIADSVRTVHVVVQEMGSVRLVLDSLSTPIRRTLDSLSPPLKRTSPIWGRDVTLVRQRDGRFWPAVRVHLLP
jgi:hypothetical protein